MIKKLICAITCMLSTACASVDINPGAGKPGFAQDDSQYTELLYAKNSASNTNKDEQAKDIEWRDQKNMLMLVKESVTFKKPMLLFFYASWCEYCMQMLDSTLKNSELIESINKSFIPIKLDIENDEFAQEISKNNNITTVPTMDFVKFVEQDEKFKPELLLRVTGYRTVDEMNKAVNAVKNFNNDEHKDNK